MKRIFGIDILWHQVRSTACELLLVALCALPAFADQSPMAVSATTLEPAVKAALAPKAPEPDMPAVELELGKLSLESVSSEDFSAGDYKKKRVMLYFWSIYCRGCVGALDTLESMRSELAAANTELLTVHLFEPRKDKLLDSLAKFGVSLPIVMAPKSVRDLFSINVLPTTLVFDEEHQLVARFEGEVDEEGLRLRLFRRVEGEVMEVDNGLINAEKSAAQTAKTVD